MTNIWQYFKDYFREAEHSSVSRPILKECIERSPAELEDFENWKNTLACRRMLGLLTEGYAMYQSMPASVDRALTFLNTPSSKGFAIHFPQTDFTRDDAGHFLDLLKEKVLTLHYFNQLSDTRSWSEKDWVQTVERHHIKPRQKRTEGGKINQQFGNITIELNLRNNRPHLLTFRATSYSDRLYADPKDFYELVQAILK